MSGIMNRTQRRAEMRANKAQQKQTTILPVGIQYGHNGEVVLVMFSKHTNVIAFEPDKLDAFVTALQESKRQLLNHQATNRG